MDSQKPETNGAERPTSECKEDEENKMKALSLKGHRKAAGVLVAVITATVIACSWPGPHLQHNAGVDRYFEGFHVYPRYQYHTAGTLEDPRAIVALKPGYTLDAPQWRAVVMTPEKLERWIAALKKSAFVEYNQFPNGADVIGRNGEVVGHYYSVWSYPRVRVPQETTITMAVPLPQLRKFNRFHMEMMFDGDHGSLDR